MSSDACVPSCRSELKQNFGSSSSFFHLRIRSDSSYNAIVMTSEIVPQELQQALDVYTKGTKAWFEVEMNEGISGWVSVTVISNQTSAANVEIVFQNDDDPEKEHKFVAKLSELTQSKLPPLRNPPKMENTDDLTNLSHLNEPSVLKTIQTRYLCRNIYTYSGIVLIAANPFDRVALYEPDIIQRYSGRRRGDLEPHLFAIAEDAYRCMIRENTNQTIVVSGESGAGKTVSAKYIMRYFATADDKEAVGKADKGGDMTEVEEQILATNPIMEAFGNAKTTRNDNSSRFGKYIEIQFDKHANIIGAKIRTYLLERSRLIFQPETERNYHIFYQLCAGAPPNERKNLGLNEWSGFHYLNQSGVGTVLDVDDVEEFKITQDSLSTIGVAVQEQWEIFRLLAALLHIGNIHIDGRKDAALDDQDPSLLKASELLGINSTEFRKWIVTRQIVTRNEKIKTNLDPTQAVVVRDSVAKYIYACLFDWLVDVVNRSLSWPQEEDIVTFIGVLDIYGFEHFKKNSFEQFCINYANEKLQQQFNQHVFKLEQEEYVKEGIDWKFIDFSDNQGCIEMIESKMGILSLLDEESRLPAGTDQSFCNKLYTNFEKPDKMYFKKPRFSTSAFIVMHYAHDVQYEAEGFIDKNKDTVPDEILEMLQNADSKFLKDMLHIATEAAHAIQEAHTTTRKSTKKPTLGSIFKTSLINLMDTIGKTNVHYIRCIKPNEMKVAWEFDPQMVLAQLRACGVLETIRISCAGYPSRWLVEDFADRYYALVNSKHWDPNLNPDVHALCKIIIDTYITDSDKFRIGHTKIFFRAGQLAYMEKLRADRWNECTILLQKNMRRFIVRLRYLRTKEIVMRLQQVARKKVAMRKLEIAKQARAATKIQTMWRGYLARKRYQQQRSFVIRLQAALRGRAARLRYTEMRRNNAAIQIQRHIRGWRARRQLQAKRNLVISIQSLIRRRKARKEYQVLRSEARSASHLKEVSYKLESKVVELTKELAAQRKEKEELSEKNKLLDQQLLMSKEKYEKLEAKSRKAESDADAYRQQKESEIEELQQRRAALVAETKKLEEKVNAGDKQIEKLNSDLAMQQKEADELETYKTSLQEQKMISSENEAKMAELKELVTGLKKQLADKPRNAPKRQSSLSLYTRNISPGDKKRNLSPDVSRSPGGMVGVARRSSRRGSSQSSIFTDKALSAEPGAIQPVVEEEPITTQMTHGDLTHLEENISPLLLDEQVLEQELHGLIDTLVIPVPNTEKKEVVVYPAHVIGLWAAQMWRRGHLAESERLLFTAMDSIQKQCMNSFGEDSITPCTFWLSNAYKLRSFICSREQELERELSRSKPRSWNELERLISTFIHELECLEDNIYYHWMKQLMKRFSKIAIPALIESQSLDGFKEKKSLFRQITAQSSQDQISMDILLGILNNIYFSMKKYENDPSVIEQAFTEIFKYIGITTFNDFVMRTKFNSWKRAMQIQYNVTRLEEWCKKRDLTELTGPLEHLMQATKLLQLPKDTVENLHSIYEICWTLSPMQIMALLKNYHVADYGEAVPDFILADVAQHVNTGADGLLLEMRDVDDIQYDMPDPCDEKNPSTNLPSSLKSERLRQLMELIKRQDAL